MNHGKREKQPEDPSSKDGSSAEDPNPEFLHDLESIAVRVSDRGRVDWSLAEANLRDAKDRALLENLSTIASLADVHRTQHGVGSAEECPFESWGHLRLLARLGRGGFGEVYRVWDEQLDREVALKLLEPSSPKAPSLDAPSESTTSIPSTTEHERRAAIDSAMLLEEARRLARVRHPNMVQVYGAEEHEGRPGFWMELVVGQRLDEFVKKSGPQGAGEAIVIGTQLCQALAAVHGADLLHRDVKPQNVMREADGRVVLMDLGASLERWWADVGGDVSTTGTPLYMAPELLQGAPASVESDLYAVGVLLFYVVTGRHPVEAETIEELKAAHEQGRRHRLADLRLDLSEKFVQVVERLLAPDPRHRPQTAGEAETELAACLPRSEGRSRGLRWLAATSVIIVAALSTVLAWHVMSPSHAPLDDDRLVLAILPFENLSGDPEQQYLCDGLTAELTSFAGSSYGSALDVLARSSVLQAMSDSVSVARLAADHGVDYALEGSLRREDDRVRVTTNLVEAGTGIRVSSKTYERAFRGLFALQTEIAANIAKDLDLDLTPARAQLLAADSQWDPQAVEEFLKGRHGWQGGDGEDVETKLRKLAQLEKAVEIEPEFALAHAAIADACNMLAFWHPSTVSKDEFHERARAAAQRALELDESLAEAHAALAMTLMNHDDDERSARRHLERAIELNPSYPTAHLRYASYWSGRDRERCVVEARRAQELDPLSQYLRGICIFYSVQAAPRYCDETLSLIVEQLRIGPEETHWCIQYLLNCGPTEEALARMATVTDVDEVMRRYRNAIDPEQIRARIDSLVTNDGNKFNVSVEYCRLGEYEEAMTWLEKIHDEGQTPTWAAVVREFDPLRSDPRFQRILGDSMTTD